MMVQMQPYWIVFEKTEKPKKQPMSLEQIWNYGMFLLQKKKTREQGKIRMCVASVDSLFWILFLEKKVLFLVVLNVSGISTVA